MLLFTFFKSLKSNLQYYYELHYIILNYNIQSTTIVYIAVQVLAQYYNISIMIIYHLLYVRRISSSPILYMLKKMILDYSNFHIRTVEVITAFVQVNITNFEYIILNYITGTIFITVGP